MPPTPDDAWLHAMVQAVQDTGARILEDWGQTPVVGTKPDGSPVTSTDDAAEHMLLAALAKHAPYKIVAEEQVAKGHIPALMADDMFWLVDALDGTRDFIAHGKDFTVNAGLIERGRPVAGFIHAPAHGITWYAAKGAGAFRIENGITQRMAVREPPADGFWMLASKRASASEVLDPFIGPHTIAKREQRSSSLKFCLVGEGKSDLYPRLTPTYEWDTAAGDAILCEAGGTVIDIHTSAPIFYGKADQEFENKGFIAGSRAVFRKQEP